MSKRDYYEVLGLSKNASTDEIRKAYRTLARKFHPDVNKESGAEAKFKEINEAYQVLSDNQKRAAYDQFGHAGPQFGAGGQGFGGFDFSDLFRGGFGGGFAESPFEDLFESFFGGGRRERSGPARGDDLRVDLEIALEEAAKGAEKELDIPHHVACPACKGTGAKPGTSPERCNECKGTGQVRRVQRTMLGSFTQITTCPECGGVGQVIKAHCPECRGRGQIRKTHKVEVKIPPGIETGHKLRISKAGDAGDRGGGPGDLYIFVTVREHPQFERDASDLHHRAKLSLTQATLGTSIAVPTLDGKTDLTVPAGTQPGTVLRIREKGLPHLNSRAKGDLYVHIDVMTPTSLTKEQAELLKEFARLRGEK